MQARANLAASGLTPQLLARGRMPVALVDLVAHGYTFTNLYWLLRDWVDQERVEWDVVRRKLRFVGITQRLHTSPNTWRWHQHADWSRTLPAAAVCSIAMDSDVCTHLASCQSKLTRSFPSAAVDHRSRRWAAPRRNDQAGAGRGARAGRPWTHQCGPAGTGPRHGRRTCVRPGMATAAGPRAAALGQLTGPGKKVLPCPSEQPGLGRR